METMIKSLKEELYLLLENKKLHDNGYVSIHKNTEQVLEEINKILKNKKLEQQEEILLALINITKTEISKDLLNCEEIFYKLPIVIKDLKKNNPDRLKELASKEKENRYGNSYEAGTNNIIETAYKILENVDRIKLESDEEMCNNTLKDKTSIFGIKDASGQIIGEFNIGMYGLTREHIINLYKESGIKVKQNDRFINSMSDDLLKYRIIGLFILSRYCYKLEKEWEQTVTDSSSHVSKEEYDKMRKRARELGKIIKNKYIYNKQITPLDEITTNITGSQTFILEAFPNLERIVKEERSIK